MKAVCFCQSYHVWTIILHAAINTNSVLTLDLCTLNLDPVGLCLTRPVVHSTTTMTRMISIRKGEFNLTSSTHVHSMALVAIMPFFTPIMRSEPSSLMSFYL